MKFHLTVICAYCGKPADMRFVDTENNMYGDHYCSCGRFLWSAYTND